MSHSRRRGEGEWTALVAAAVLAFGCRAGPASNPPPPPAPETPIAPWPDSAQKPDEEVRATDLDPLEEGISRLRMGLSEDATHLLESSVERDPTNVRALYFLGLAHAYDYRFGEARTVWERVLSLARDRIVQARIETTIGLTYEIEGRCGEAVEHLQAALTIVPGYPVARDELSALRRRGPVRCFNGNWTEPFALFLFADMQQ